MQEKLKITFIGPEGTGKTQLINRFISGTFNEVYKATMGIDFLSKTCSTENHQSIRAQLWDTAGHDRFQSLLPPYIRDSYVVAIVLATTDPTGAPINKKKLKEDAKKWYDLATREASRDAPIYFVINKTDLHSASTLSDGEVNEVLAEVAHIPVLSCSAKTGAEVTETFNKILAGAYCSQCKTENIPECFLPPASVFKPTDLTDNQPSVLSSKSQSPGEKFLKFLADHKILFIGNGILIAAAIIILASLPVGGLPVLAGLSALAVAGITAAVVLLVWNLCGIIGNLIFKDGPPSTGEDLQNLSLQEPIDPEQPAPEPPGGAHHGSIYTPAEETEKENALPKPLQSSPPASDSQPSNTNK